MSSFQLLLSFLRELMFVAVYCTITIGFIAFIVHIVKRYMRIEQAFLDSWRGTDERLDTCPDCGCACRVWVTLDPDKLDPVENLTCVACGCKAARDPTVSPFWYDRYSNPPQLIVSRRVAEHDPPE